MIRRILFVIVFTLCLPIVMVMAFSIVPMGFIGLLRWVLLGGDDLEIHEFIQAPFVWAVELPYKIMGE